MAVFATVVAEGSLAGAARRLGMTPSAVSQHMRSLEKALGVPLLHRSTRRLALTEAGAAFYPGCEAMLQQAKQAEQRLAELRDTLVGELRIATPVGIGGRSLAEALSPLLQAHPKLTLRVLADDRIVDMIEQRVDIALRANRQLADANMIAHPLTAWPMVLCAAPDYLLKKGTPQSVDDLLHHAAINYLQAGRVLSWQLMDSEGASHTFTPRSSLNMDDLQAICDAALAGHGIAWLPCWMVSKEIHQGKLVPLLKQAPDVRFDVHAVWQQTPHLPLRVRIAVDTLASRLPSVMSLDRPAPTKKPR